MSTPPNMPPGGGQPPYGTYDPKTQWRVYREQQKAAWRAQRDAMKAQRYAAKAGYYGGVYTPRVPSIVGPIILIGVGIVALLIVTGHIDAPDFWTWYAHWWPLLLIGAGIALLFWLYIVSLSVLCGAEFNAQFDSQWHAHFGRRKELLDGTRKAAGVEKA